VKGRQLKKCKTHRRTHRRTDTKVILYFVQCCEQDKLQKKFSALNVDFNGPSLDLLGSRKPAHEGIKKRYPLIIVIVPLLASLP